MEIKATVSAVLGELEAIRRRLEQAREWRASPETAVLVAARSREVEELCRKAALCRAPADAGPLLTEARRQLDGLHRLLGLH